MTLLSRLLLSPYFAGREANLRASLLDAELLNINRDDFDRLTALANSNHVVVRGMERFAGTMRVHGDTVREEWAEDALAAERSRIGTAIRFLRSICTALEEEGHDGIVIKSLDHWPDLGSDLDLFTTAAPEVVLELMKRRFEATLAPRSWGDRLARKWNFLIPGLPEAVEIHVGRLGQTGEQRILASSVARRARHIAVDGVPFRVPHISDRLMISALQRMYRHFYFRLCDIIDSAALAENGSIDYGDLRRAAVEADIWEGMATYLVIVADYVNQYRGSGISLPDVVTSAARFGGEKIYYAKEFLRVPILPQSAGLYRTQLGGLLRKGELESSVRLGLLPWLAGAAVVGQKITGSDKGIW
ncbi:MAG: hypothetical protein ACLGXA_08740 [Acidobacteriota bacterium]